jgi:hypothetical protein
VGYYLQLNESLVAPYLHNHPALSREDRVKVFSALNDLRERADSFRSSVERRFAPGSPYFWYDIVLRCTDGLIRNFWFLVNDSAANYGVLRVEYADEGTSGPG